MPRCGPRMSLSEGSISESPFFEEIPEDSTLRKKPKHNLKICFLNIQCLRNKVHLLDAFLIDGSYDVVCLSEHWLTADEIECVSITNYCVVSYFCRSLHLHGGVLILARKNLQCVNVLG